MNTPYFYLSLVIGIVFILSVLVIFFKLFNMKSQKVRKIVITMVVLATFVVNLLGTINAVTPDGSGFSQFFIYLATVFKAVIYTVMTFTLKDNYSSFGASIKANSAFTFFYYFINLTGLTVWAFAILTWLSVGLNSYIKMHSLFSKNIHVFSQINDKSITLAKDIKNNEKNALIIFISPKITKGESAKNVSKNIINQGFALATLQSGTDFFSKIGLPKRHLKRNINFYCFSDNDADNFEFAQKHLQEFNAVQNAKIYIKTENRADENDMNIEKNHNSVLLYESFLSATSLLNKCPLHKAVKLDEILDAKANKTLKLGIVGFGKTGEEVFKKMFVDGQNAGIEIETIIFDKNISQNRGIFFNRNPQLNKFARIDTIDCCAKDDKFFNIIENTHIDYFAICLGEDCYSIEIANRIKKFYETHRMTTIIAVHVREKKNELLLEKSGDNSIIIKPFGNYNEIYNVDIIIKDKLNKIAKIVRYLYGQVHRFYDPDIIASVQDKARGNKDIVNEIISKTMHEIEIQAEAEWRSTTHLNRRSSLSRAEYFTHKLYFIKKRTKGEIFEQIEINNVLASNLAESEHMRWVAYHMVNGWSSIDYEKLEQDPHFIEIADEVKFKHKKDALGKRHVCLTQFRNLKEVGRIFHQDLIMYSYLCNDILKLFLEKDVFSSEQLLSIYE